MKRLVAAAVVLAGIGIPTAVAQVPPLPLPTSTTTTTASTTAPTTAPEPVTTLPPETASTDVAPSVTTGAGGVPSVVPPTAPSTVVPSASTTTVPRRTLTTLPEKRTAAASALSGSFAAAVAILLVVTLLLIALSTRANPGGFRMNDPRRRWRLIAGVASLALAAIVGLIGWLKVSIEPQVNRQIPYLTSAGMTLVVLAAIGGSLLVAEQLRTDDRRIEELEDAVRKLSATLEPLIESPPR